MTTILVTGGAGFIGSHVSDELLNAGYHVRALDNLILQVHERRARPEYLDHDIELLVDSVGNRDAVRRVLDDVDAVFHFAAHVGVGQSVFRLFDRIAEANAELIVRGPAA
jgi:dTDP-L-rhamnose 4-epimerase